MAMGDEKRVELTGVHTGALITCLPEQAEYLIASGIAKKKTTRGKKKTAEDVVEDATEEATEEVAE